jgi:hypothetical protein
MLHSPVQMQLMGLVWLVMFEKISEYSDLATILTFLGGVSVWVFSRFKKKNKKTLPKDETTPLKESKLNIQIGKGNINVGDNSKVKINSKD